MDRPCRITYDMKKLEAFGRLEASRSIAFVGSLTISVTVEVAAEDRVVTKKTWIT